MKKILVVNNFFSPVGGAEIIAFNTYKLLQKNDYEVFFFANKSNNYFEKDYKYTKYFPKCNSGIKNYIRNPFKYYYNLETKNKLKYFINDVKPDLIHLHGVTFFSPSIFDSCKNIPTIMTVHDAGTICPSSNLLFNNKTFCKKQCKNFNFLPCIRNKCVKNKLEPSIRHAVFSYIYTKLLKNVDYFITPSLAMKKCIINADININNDKIATINNFLTEQELFINPNFKNKKYFLYIGRLSQEKGLNFLLETINKLPRDIELHIVGTGPNENNLKKYAKDNNLYNVLFLGFKTREELLAEYQNCIATIIPSNCFDNFPTTNMESFINGKPIIGSNIGGIPEQIEHNKTGLLFEPANIEQLKKCILTYWNNPDLVVEHGKNAYEKARTLYTEERYFKELIKVYNEILERELK